MYIEQLKGFESELENCIVPEYSSDKLAVVLHQVNHIIMLRIIIIIIFVYDHICQSEQLNNGYLNNE